MRTLIIISVVAILMVVIVIAMRKAAWQKGWTDGAVNAAGQSMWRGSSFFDFITEDAYRAGQEARRQAQS